MTSIPSALAGTVIVAQGCDSETWTFAEDEPFGFSVNTTESVIGEGSPELNLKQISTGWPATGGSGVQVMRSGLSGVTGGIPVMALSWFGCPNISVTRNATAARIGCEVSSMPPISADGVESLSGHPGVLARRETGGAEPVTGRPEASSVCLYAGIPDVRI